MARELSDPELTGARNVHVADRSRTDTISYKPASSNSNFTPSSATITIHPSVTTARLLDGGTSLLFADGSRADDIDIVLWCTGYCYDFPFLDRNILEEDDMSHRRVRRLYKHLFLLDHPSMAFVGLPFSVVPFPLMYLQAL